MLTILLIWLLSVSVARSQAKQSNYAVHIARDFNQSGFYPLNQNPGSHYKPVADWVGRLILPTREELGDGLDWVWMEVESAPGSASGLVGKVVRLQWQKNPDLETYLQGVRRDINFSESVIQSQQQGIIHPSRLNQVRNVGVLRSLAGANPLDDAIVAFRGNTVVIQDAESKTNTPILEIDSEPVLVAARFYGLVKIIKPVPSPVFQNSAKSHQKPSPEYFLVQHYNPTSQKFDGTTEIIRIPQQTIDTRGFAPSTPRQIEKSPGGTDGWYIYGAKDVNNIFVARAIVPATLFALSPRQTIVGTEAGINYIKHLNWRNTPNQKGKLNTVLVLPDDQSATTWQEGDKAIVLHLFGGIGGEKAEPLGVVETITGHFAFGIAEVIRDEFTNKLRFDIKYYQIYAHNPDGIISGIHNWDYYMGNLQHGWLHTRPVSDVLIKFAPVTQDYDFDGVKLSPIQEFQKQLQIAIARYRTGDGTGGATVSPATSCVQDSNQALYATIQVIKQQIATNPQIQTWLQTNPDHPQTQRFQQLVQLGQSLEQQLTPLGIIRADWQSQASMLAGTGRGEDIQPFRDGSIWAGLTTWRTMMPRQSHDDIARIFLQQGATLQFLRTNQVGGWQSTIKPLAPTVFFGQIKIPQTDISPLPVLLNRLLASLLIPTTRDLGIVAIALIFFSVITIPIGFKFNFLHLQYWSGNWLQKLLLSLRCLFLPALLEELFFRVLLLPHPIETTNWYIWGMWGIFGLFLFIIYHQITAKYLSLAARAIFSHPIFFSLATLLGITCTITYALTGSLWTIVFIHWIVVMVWLVFMGGMGKFSNS
ncbi:CPBP family glutamic-type intramembrane protease [Calothrix sp. NIES-3974]|uniref:CPBP family glutamic-type intramembrane protease n=1 Tax=Calothrix sp. NIES-3974 TaxID=2005462 RepID=UPI001E2AB3BE|nr:CPBP family glutamic-type intramembrane protease [Calothrix sp. NIES-3974]